MAEYFVYCLKGAETAAGRMQGHDSAHSRDDPNLTDTAPP